MKRDPYKDYAEWILGAITIGGVCLILWVYGLMIESMKRGPIKVTTIHAAPPLTNSNGVRENEQKHRENGDHK